MTSMSTTTLNQKERELLDLIVEYRNSWNSKILEKIDLNLDRYPEPKDEVEKTRVGESLSEQLYVLLEDRSANNKVKEVDKLYELIKKTYHKFNCTEDYFFSAKNHYWSFHPPTDVFSKTHRFIKRQI